MGRTIGAAAASHAQGRDPRRPAWWWTTAATALAVVLALPLLAGLGALADAHLLPTAAPLERSLPLMDDGLWALLASAGVVGLVAALLTGTLAAVVAVAGGGWRMHPGVALFAFALASLLSGAATDAIVSWWLVVPVVVLRTWGFARAARPARLPGRARWAIAAGCAVLLLATATYQPFNPVRVVAAAGIGTPDAFGFALTVDSPGGTRIVELDAPDGLGSLDVRLHDPRQLGRHLDAGEVVRGRVAIPAAWCPSTSGETGRMMTTLHARVETPAGVRTQLLRLEANTTIDCPEGG